MNRNKNEDEGRFWCSNFRSWLMVPAVAVAVAFWSWNLSATCVDPSDRSHLLEENKTTSTQATSTEAKSFVQNNLPTMSCQNFLEDHLSVEKLLTVLTIESLQRGTNKPSAQNTLITAFNHLSRRHANKVRHYFWKQRYTRRIKQIHTIFILRHSNPQN